MSKSKNTKRQLLTILLMLIFVCASVLTVEAIANRRLLRLSGDARADLVLSLEEATITGNATAEDEGFEEDFEEDWDDEWDDEWDEDFEEDFEEDFTEDDLLEEATEE